jgi:hypothetical protein
MTFDVKEVRTVTKSVFESAVDSTEGAELEPALVLPRRGRGRQSAEAQTQYERDLAAFCEFIRQYQSRLDFAVSARGWGYTLEGEGLINKNDIDVVENLINDARKCGSLPVDICAVDVKRQFEHVGWIDSTSPEEEAKEIVEQATTAYRLYRPFSFWDDQEHYLQCVVEKLDLKSLFSKTSEEFYIPLANAGGWGDLHVRADMMRRFAYWEGRGKHCVLLYVGDHDPGGLRISGFLASNMSELSAAVGWSPEHLLIDRIGLNRDYIDRHELVWIENLITNAKGDVKDLADADHRDHDKAYVQEYIRAHGARKVEANALLKRPDAARQWYREQICRYVAPSSPKRYAAKLRPHQGAVRAEVLRLLQER